MLTADLVNARRYKGELRITKLEGANRERATELAAIYLAIAHDHVGRTRDELEAAWDAVTADDASARLSAGIRKLVEDGCDLDSEPDVDPTEIRRDVFLRAAAARKALGEGDRLDRMTVLAEVGAARGTDAATVERLLYADLKGAHVVQTAPVLAAADLVARYDMAQAQAVLLRAVKVTCDVRCASAGLTRALFRKLKFLRLLHTIIPLDDDRYRIEIDGPFSLFESVTKYGLKLAMLLPTLSEVDAWALEADLRWGKEREHLVFRAAGETASTVTVNGKKERAEAHLTDEVAALLAAVRGMETPWSVKPAATVLDLPGIGLSVPDLVFTHETTKKKVYVEVMGYWSRDAVWKRVELIEQGMRHRVLFAVSSRLRVSEQVLPDEAPGALYVYKGTMSPKAVLEKVARIADRSAPT